MVRLLSVLALLTALLPAGRAGAQLITTKPNADTLRVVHLINADRLSYFKPDSTTELQMLAGNVQLKQENTIFYCDSAVFNKKLRYIEAFGKVHIRDNDTTDIYSQYLQYYVDTRIAYLKKNVKLTDNKSTLFTEDLTYDLNTKIGDYRNGGKLINQQSVLTSKEGTYYAELKDVYFKKSVDLKDPKYSLKTDSLLYNTTTQLATFIAPTTIIDSAKRTIKTSEGYYDTKNRKAFFGKRPTLTDGAVKIIANTIESDDSTGVSKLFGSAVYVDTAQGVSVLANYIEANRGDGTFRATQHPLMIIKQDKDSIYITADTLYSGRLSHLANKPDSIITRDTLKTARAINAMVKPAKDSATAGSKPNDSTDRYFQAYHHVRIFSDSMQAVSDSLWYSGKDSIFRLFTNPILWASNSQITGDTILLYTKNKKPERMFVYENALAVNLSDTNMYNQIKGNRLNAYFLNGDFDYMRAQGNAASVFYVKDEKNALVGINNTTADIIDIRYKDKQLDKVVNISNVEGTLYPYRQASEENKQLRGFKWQEARRPKTKFELMFDEAPAVPRNLEVPAEGNDSTALPAELPKTTPPARAQFQQSLQPAPAPTPATKGSGGPFSPIRTKTKKD